MLKTTSKTTLALLFVGGALTGWGSTCKAEGYGMFSYPSCDAMVDAAVQLCRDHGGDHSYNREHYAEQIREDLLHGHWHCEENTLPEEREAYPIRFPDVTDGGYDLIVPVTYSCFYPSRSDSSFWEQYSHEGQMSLYAETRRNREALEKILLSHYKVYRP